MIKTIVSVDLPIDEKLEIKKNSITGKGKNNESEKRFCLITGIHGDELEGQLVCFNVIQRLMQNLECLNGTVDVYPALNPLGLHTTQRHIPGFDMDMNRTFPGETDGTMVEYITSEILKDVKGATFALDVHASNIFISEVPQVRIPCKYSEKLKSFSEKLNMDLVWIHDSTSVKESSLSYTLNECGTNAVVIDMGIGIGYTKELSEKLTDGIFCLLKTLGMWEGKTIEPKKPYISSKTEETEFIYAPCFGFFVKNKECGCKIEKGELLGKIIDPLEGVVKCEIRSPSSGFLFTVREYPCIEVGSLLGRVLNEKN